MEKLKAKKSLGQNFLKEESIIDQIIESANLSVEDNVIEIGPGQGALTEKLSKACGKVIAIELDDRLIDLLHTNFVGIENVEIIHGDILKVNLPEIVDNKFDNKKYKVIANIPYYITAPIIRLLLETKYPADEITLMVQKEVAERIVAKPGQMSILAVAVQYYANAKYLFTVPRTAFDPMPKVDSAVICITRKMEREAMDKEETKRFFKIVRAGFSAKRKTLVNNLSSSLQIPKNEIEKKLETMSFSKNVRAQELSVEDWKQLTLKLS